MAAMTTPPPGRKAGVRVLVIGPTPPPHHGVSVFIPMIVDALRRSGVAVRHLDTADRRGVATIGALDVRNVALGLLHMARTWSITLAWRPTLVLFPISQAALPVVREVLWMLVPLAAGSRVVPLLRGAYFAEFYENSAFVVRWVVRWLLRRATRVVVECERTASVFRGLVPPGRVDVLPNVVPDGTGAETVPPEAPRAGFRVLYLGNRIRAKGYLELVAAAGFLKDEIPDLEIDITGDRFDVTEREERELVERHGVGSIIHWVGLVSGDVKRDLLRRADVLALPSFYPLEGQPVVLLEGMAAGLPIVTTRVGCIPETVVEGQNALLVPGRDAVSLANALRTLWRDGPMRHAFGRRSRELWHERYRLAVFQERLARLVRSVTVA